MATILANKYDIVAFSVRELRARILLCKCGYDFASEMEVVTRGASQCSDTYAVIREDHYRRFMKSEVKAWTAESKKKRLKAIGKAAQYISRMYECPECARLVVNFPESDEIAFYAREE